MSTRSFLTGFAITGALGVAGAISGVEANDARPVHHGPKTFYGDQDDQAEDRGYVVAEGTLAGEGMNDSTFVHVECRHERVFCRIADLLSLGGNRSVLLHTDEWPTESWTKDMIVLQSETPASACNRVHLVINRTTHAVEYDRIPQEKRDASPCKTFTNEMFKCAFEVAKAQLKELSPCGAMPSTPFADYGLRGRSELTFATAIEEQCLQTADLIAGSAMRFGRGAFGRGGAAGSPLRDASTAMLARGSVPRNRREPGDVGQDPDRAPLAPCCCHAVRQGRPRRWLMLATVHPLPVPRRRT